MSKSITDSQFLTALLLVGLWLGLPSGVNAVEIARYGGEFMSGGGGARSLAMGGAQTALGEDAWTLFWNPAGLGRLSVKQMGLTHSERFDGEVNYDAAALALPQPDGSSLGLGLIRLGVGEIPFTEKERPGEPLSNDNRIEVKKIVNEAEYALLAARAFPIGNWQLGLAPKVIFKHFGWDHRAFGIGIDAGLLGRPIDRLPLETGLVVHDVLSTPVYWETTGHKEVIAPSIRSGLSSQMGVKSLDAVITTAVDYGYRFESIGASDAGSFHAGFEYLIHHLVALRVGSDDGRLTLGGGLSFNSMSVDYAFYEHDYLGLTHRVSLNVRWGAVRE